MAGTIETLRTAGIVSGFPAELDANVKVRWVAPMLVNMSERETDLLKYVGGPERFSFNNTQIEWPEDDPWNRRLLTHGGLTAGTTTALAGVTAASHRYPVGTVLFNPNDGEYVRVTGHADANTLTIVRDITAAVTEGAWASTEEVIVAAMAMDENDNYVYRPTSIFTLPFNHPQVHQAGVQVTFRRSETALYGVRGNDLDMQAANLVAEQFTYIEQSLVHGSRFAGSSAVPSMMGGLKFYITTANGSVVNDMSDAALARSDIDGDLQTLYYQVGGGKMARTLLVGAWGKRKVSSFWAAAERLGPGTGMAGVVVDRLNTDFGVVDVLLQTALAQDELFLIRREQIEMGHHGQLGRPQLRVLPPSTTGPFIQKVFYADLSCIISGVQAMARRHNYSTTT